MLGLPDVDFGKVLTRLDTANSSACSVEGRWWSMRMVSPTLLVAATVPAPDDLDLEKARFELVGALTLLFTFLTIVTWLASTGRWQIYLSIR